MTSPALIYFTTRSWNPTAEPDLNRFTAQSVDYGVFSGEEGGVGLFLYPIHTKA